MAPQTKEPQDSEEPPAPSIVRTLDGASFMLAGVGGLVAAAFLSVSVYVAVVIAAIVLLSKAGAFKRPDARAYGFAIALVVLCLLPLGYTPAFVMACVAIHMLGTMKGEFLDVRIRS